MIWQNQLINSGALDEQRKYWSEVYSDGIPKLNLPIDRNCMDSIERPMDFEGVRYDFRISKKIADQLNELVKQTNTTKNIVLLAGYYLLLAKYTNQEDIAIGTMTAGRGNDDLNNIIGHFVNVLAIRNSPQGMKTFRTFLGEVKASSLQAYENADYPFEMLAENLQIDKKPSETHGLDVLFTYTIMDSDQPDPKQKTVSDLDINLKSFLLPLGSVTENLFLLAIEVNKQLGFQFRYKKELFKAKTIRKMKDNYILILRQIIENPDIRIADIKIDQNKYLYHAKKLLK